MSVLLGTPVTEFRRRALLRVLAAAPVTTSDPLEPWAEDAAVWEVFADRDDLLRSLQELWTTLLSRRVHGDERYPLGADRVREVYGALAEDYPTLRAALDDHQDDAAIGFELDQEKILIARAAGNLGQSSMATLVRRGRDLLAEIPAQREG